MADLLDLYVSINADTSGLDSAIRRSEGNLSGLGNTSSRVGDIIRGSLAGQAIIGAITTGWNLITDSVGGAIERYDTLNNYTVVMQNLGYSTEDAAKAQDRLTEGVLGLPTSLDSIVLMQEQYAALTGELETSTDWTLALNDAVLAGGNSQEIANSALDQWYQIIANGQPDLQSWRIINQAMPAQLQAIAQECLGAEASSTDLFNAWKDGTVTTEEVMNAVVALDQNGSESMASFHDQAVDANSGIATSAENMRTAVERGVSGIIQKYDEWAESSSWPTIEEAIGMLGEAFEGFLEVAGDVLIQIVSWLEQLTNSPAWTVIGPALEVVATALVALGVAWGVVTVAQSIYNAVLAVTDALSAPVYLIIMAIIAAIVLLATHWEEVCAIAQTVWEAITGFITGAWEIITGIWETIVGFFSGIWEGIQGVFSAVREWFGGKFESAKQGVQTAWSTVTGFFGTVWSGIQGVFSTVRGWFTTKFQSAKQGVQTAWSTVTGFFGTVWSGIQGVFSNVRGWFTTKFQGARQGIQGAWSGIRGFFSGKWQEIRNVFSDARSKFSSIGRQIVAGIKSGIREKWSNLTSWVGEKCQALWDSITGFFQVGSPSKLFAGLGEDLVLGLEEGFDDEFDNLERLVANDMEEIANLGPNMVGTIDYSESISGNSANSSEQTYNKILDLLQKYLPQLANTEIILDGRTLVGEMIDDIDRSLSVRAARAARA